MKWKSIRKYLCLLTIVVTLNVVFWQPKVDPKMESVDIGGAFPMADIYGRPVTEKDFSGKPMLVFFGFTSCASVCPITLTNISAWLKELWPEGADLQPIRVTVDPERDTQALLKECMKLFDPRIIALRGTREQLDDMIRTFKAFYKKVPLQGSDYTIDHTALVYLIRSDGTFKGTIDFHEPAKTAIPKLKLLLTDTAK